MTMSRMGVSTCCKAKISRIVRQISVFRGQLHATERTLILGGAREQPRQLIHQGEFEELIGKENFCDNVQEAPSEGSF